MKALLLAGGYGTRLKPITDLVPKCLVPIAGRPLIDYWIESLKKAGIERILINTHYLNTQMEDYKKKIKYSNYIELIYEPVLKGTAGTLIENYQYWKEENSLLVAHADNYCLASLEKFKKAHFNRPRNCHITMMTFRTKNPTKCGVVILSKEGIVTQFYEKVPNPPSNIANGAIYIFSNIALKIIYEKYPDAVDISNDILPKFLGKIYTYETKATLVDIGSLESYRYVCDNFDKLK